MFKWYSILFFMCLMPSFLYAQLAVSFTFTPDSACSGTSVKFKSTVTSPNNSTKLFLWNFGDGVTSKLANPVHTYVAYGCSFQTFAPILIVTDTTNGLNISESIGGEVHVKQITNPQLTDILNPEPFSNCSNSPTPDSADFDIKVQNITAPSSLACILSYNLNWGDGDSLTGVPPGKFTFDHTYTKLGAFSLTITAITENGCNGKTTYIVKNQSNPAVGLASDGGTEGCAPQTFPFTLSKDERNSPGTTYLWDFGDNTPTFLWTKDSVAVNNGKISHIFNSTSCGKPDNVFSVKVTAINSCKNTPVTIGGISMSNAPIPDFDINSAIGCEKSGDFCFTNYTTPGGYGTNCDRTTTYFWDFGNGNTSPAQNPPCQKYPIDGPHTITLTATNKCGSRKITKDILVQTMPTAVAEANATNGCVPFPVRFINKSIDSANLLYTWSVSPDLGWSFSNNTGSYSKNPELQFTVAGTYSVTLTVNNKCGGTSTTITIQANDIPSVALPLIPNNCFPFTYTGNATYVTNGSAVTAYLWSVNPAVGWAFDGTSTSASQNPSIVFSQAGHYQVNVKATNGCGSIDSTSNNFEVFTPVPVKVGNDTAVCVNSGDFQILSNPSGGTWIGSNISAAGIFSPVSAGDYTLTYSKGTGNCLREDKLVVKVLQAPIVNAGADALVCVNSGLLTLTGNPLGGTWSGTGITDGGLGIFDPSKPGTGVSSLIYSYTDNTSKCSNTDELQINVLPFPIVLAEDVTFCNQPIAEQLSATPPGGTWTGLNVTAGGLYTPAGVGKFDLIYTFIDNNNCSGSDRMTVTVKEPDMTVSAGGNRSICSNDSVFLVGTPVGGTWKGKDVMADGYFDPASAGNYKLYYSTGSGSCFRSDSMIVNVKPSPKAGFSAGNVCSGETTFFQDQSQGGGVNLSKWLWEYGDSYTSLLQNPPHYFLNPGTYPVTLLVENESGCTDSVVKPVEVLELPVVNFNFDIPACINVPVSFTNNCTNAKTYLWDFGDGITSAQFEPGHAYVNEGTYKVKLTATSGLGCVFSDSLLIAITGPPPKPFFQLSHKEGCGPLTTYFSIDTTQYNKKSSYSWDFGNGITSNSLIPPDSIIYTGSLIRDTVLYIRFTSGNFCKELVYSDSVRIHPKPLVDFGMLHNWDCSPVEVKFQNVTLGAPDSYYWNFGDGKTSTQPEPVHSYTTGNSSSIYVITLISYNGCGSDTLSRDLIVKPNTVTAFFNVDDFKGCEGDAFCFRNYSTDTSSFGITNLSWDFGDGQGSSLENPCHIYTRSGKYVAKLYVDNGCGYDETNDTITINPAPQINITSNNEACEKEPLLFNFSSNVDLAGKVWYFGDGDSSVLSNPYHSYKNFGTYEVSVSGKSASGFPACYGMASKQVTIKPSPVSFILPDTSACAPVKITFKGDEGSTHLWNFGKDIAFTTNPTHLFDSAGLFLIKLISENSSRCKDSSNIEIQVFPSPKSQFTYTTTGNYPEHVSFINSSSGTTECSWDFGNGQALSLCAVNEPVLYSNNGDYVVSLITRNQLGCTDTAQVHLPINFNGLFVPNALIPEHPDPAENLFLPKGIGLKEYTIQIFDTWGNLIWQSSALVDGMPSEGWNGRDSNGNLYPQDVYAWRASAKFTDGTYWKGDKGKTYGTVTLIR